MIITTTTINYHQRPDSGLIIQAAQTPKYEKDVPIITTTTNYFTPQPIMNKNNNNNISKHRRRRSKKANNNNKIMFVHVGKTGGETIKDGIRHGCNVRKNKAVRNHCLLKLNNNDTAISNAIIAYMHLNHYDPPRSSSSTMQVDTFLYSLRHPVQRTISWFRNISPYNCIGIKKKATKTKKGIKKATRSNCQTKRSIKNNLDPWAKDFFSCFHTVEEFAMALTSNNNSQSDDHNNNDNDTTTTTSNNNNKCSMMAWSKVQQNYPDWDNDRSALHLTANIKYYVNETIGGKNHAKANQSILVVRTEHLWDDMKSIDIMLGGNGYFINDGTRITHGSEKYNDINSISIEGTKRLCCALKDELQIYHTLIQMSINLNEFEKNQTILQSFHQCYYHQSTTGFWETDLEIMCQRKIK